MKDCGRYHYDNRADWLRARSKGIGLMTCGNTLGLYSPCVNLKPMESPACASCWQRLDTRQRGALLDAYRATVNEVQA